MPAGGSRMPGRAAPLDLLEQRITRCRRCPRLVEWRERVAREKRAAFREEDYWGRPVPGFGDPRARVYVLGLAPAAHGGNRTGRVFTGDRSGDWLFGALLPDRVREPADLRRTPATACACATPSSLPRCAARRRPTSHSRTSATTASRTPPRSSS